jgi:hypothetical protein
VGSNRSKLPKRFEKPTCRFKKGKKKAGERERRALSQAKGAPQRQQLAETRELEAKKKKKPEKKNTW